MIKVYSYPGLNTTYMYICRLLSLSSGHTELQLDTWLKLKAMEVERRARLNQLLLNQ